MKIKSFIYRNHSCLYSPFNVGLNVFRFHRIYEYVTSQLIPTTIYSQEQLCSHKRCGAKPPRGAGHRGLSLCLLLPTPRRPDKGAALAGPLRPRVGLEGRGGAGLWGAGMGRAARVQRGRPGSVPQLSAVSLRNRPLGFVGARKQVLLME